MLPCKSRFLFLFLGCVVLPSAEGAQCNSNDVNYWKKKGGYFTFEAQAEEAGKRAGLKSCPGCSVEDFYPLALPIIAEEFPQYTQGCQDCFNGLISCVRIVCFTQCVDAYFFETSTVCETCAETNCDPTFNNCSGLNLLSCPDCIKPEEQDLTPILAGVAGVAVTGILLFVGYNIYKSYKYGPNADERAQEQLADMGILVKVDESQPAPHTRADELGTVSKMEMVPFEPEQGDTFPDNFDDNLEFGTTPEKLFPNDPVSGEFIPMEVPENMENSLSVVDDDERDDIF